MKFLPRLILFLVVITILGVGFVLATWDIPAPTSDVQEVIPNDRFN